MKDDDSEPRLFIALTLWVESLWYLFCNGSVDLASHPLLFRDRHGHNGSCAESTPYNSFQSFSNSESRRERRAVRRSGG